MLRYREALRICGNVTVGTIALLGLACQTLLTALAVSGVVSGSTALSWVALAKECVLAGYSAAL